MTTSHEQSKTASELKAVHTPLAVRKRLEETRSDRNLGEFVLGGIDGTITTFAIVAGAIGADLAAGIVVILGIANLIADGFSMGIGVFLGKRSENQHIEKTRRMEERHIALIPKGEIEEVRQIFAAKGFEGKDLERVVEVITSDRDRWVDTMILEEHGLIPEGKNPGRAGITTFSAFIAVGVIPLIPFLVNVVIPGWVSAPFIWSAVLTGFAFFLIGAIKSRFVDASWLYGGLEILGIGGFAAGVAYGIGYALKGLVDAI